MRAHLAGVAFFVIGILTSTSAAGQARIERIIPEPQRVALHRAGATRVERAANGLELLPGDMVSAIDTSLLELSCGQQSGNRYRMRGPFRVRIDVPVDTVCHINVDAGQGEVLAESPTHTTVGGVPLGSTGTQYSVEATREGTALVRKVVVFDGQVQVRGSGRGIVAGSKRIWAGRDVRDETATTAEIDRSAALYARFDVAAAVARAPSADPSAMYQQLKQLHYDVLASPSDTTKRVMLAKRQIDYRIDDQAAYNLKRANVTNDAAARRYQIDPAVIRANPAMRTSYRAFSGAVQPEIAAVVEARVATTDGDLQLIARGQVDQAIQNLERRIAGRQATSRDHYALAKAYGTRNNATQVRSQASRALVLHATDGKLSATELRELGELLARAG